MWPLNPGLMGHLDDEGVKLGLRDYIHGTYYLNLKFFTDFELLYFGSHNFDALYSVLNLS